MPAYHPQGSLDSWAILIMYVCVIKQLEVFLEMSMLFYLKQK